MIDREQIKQILREELSKTDSDKLLKSREFEQKVKAITTKVIEEFYKIMWQKKNFWSDSISK